MDRLDGCLPWTYNIFSGKECPFCGDTHVLVRHDVDGYYIGCSNDECIAAVGRLEAYKTEAEAIEAWNKREK